MIQEFIPYEQALVLKELGFDEPCLKYWNGIGEYFDQKDWFNWNQSEKFVSIPLYQQAFRWFREKYGLYVSINIHADNMWSVIIKSMTNNSTHTSGSVVDLINKGYSTFKSYEEAELACLKKLIEIVKKK
jgi:hypothetical protein